MPGPPPRRKKRKDPLQPVRDVAEAFAAIKVKPPPRKPPPRTRRQKQDLEILAADYTPTLRDVTDTLKPPPKRPKKTPKGKPLNQAEQEALREARLTAARGASIDPRLHKFLRDTRPSEYRPILEPQQSEVKYLTRPKGGPKKPSFETALKARKGDKKAQQEIERWQAYEKKWGPEKPWTEDFWQRPFTSATIFPVWTPLELTRASIGDIETMARGLVPMSMKFGGMLKHDIMHPDTNIDAQDVRDIWELMKWTAGDQHDKRKLPHSDAAWEGFLAETLKGWQHSLRREIPFNITDPQDWRDAKEAWSADPLMSILDTYPLAAAAVRPASAAAIAARIAEAQPETSALRAAGRGIRESYVPGREAAAGREGGIAPRVARTNINGQIVESIARPWSRQPIIRGAQKAWDDWHEAHPRPGQHRVARTEERLGHEAERRIKHEARTLTEDISQFTFSKLGRFKASFGPRKNMTIPERQRATALMYSFQLPRDLPIEDGLRAVVRDKQEILTSGKYDLPGGETARLATEDKQAIAREISDLEHFLTELDRGGPKMASEMTGALEALKAIADKAEVQGLEIMRRVYGDEAMPEIRRQWANRKGMLTRRLQGKGILGGVESDVRDARFAQLVDQLGPERAQVEMAITDARARKVRPQDPASYYADRIGMPGETDAASFVGAGHFQPAADRAGVRSMVEQTGKTTGKEYFYSPLQRAMDDVLPETGTVGSYESKIRGLITQEEYYNMGLDLFFESMPGQARMTKAELQNHLSSPLNAYNLEEYYFRDGATNVKGDNYDTWWDKDFDGALLSREAKPGEYREIVMRLPGEGRDFPYEGGGEQHWWEKFTLIGRHHKGAENVVAHIRFQVFEENGVRKLLIEEIQSDWASDYRKAIKDRGPGVAPYPEAPEHARLMQERVDETRPILEELDQHAKDLNTEIAQAESGTSTLHDLQRELVDLNAMRRRLRNQYDDMVAEVRYLNGGTLYPPAPLGDKYYRAAIRRMVREAVDENVGEIMFVDGKTQHARGDAQMLLDPSLPPVDNHVLRNIDNSALVRLYTKDFPRFLEKDFGVEGRQVANAYEGRLSTPMGHMAGDFSGIGDMPAVVFKVTDGMKAKASIPQKLYQQQPNWDALPRGATELLANGNTAIRMFERGDVSTWIHELGHVALYDLAPDDLAVIEKHLAGDRRLADWVDTDHERFARSFETYVQQGYAPTRALESVFAKLKGWIGEIWQQTGQQAETIHPEVKAIFDDMFHLPDDSGATWGYFPHREYWDLAQSDYRGPVRTAAGGETIGKARLGSETVQRKPNELHLYQTGQLSPDPSQLMDVYLNRIRYMATVEARDSLWNKGIPLSEVPKGQETGGWIIRSPHDPPSRITPATREAVRQGRDRMEKSIEVTDGAVPEERFFGGNYDDFRRELLAKYDERPHWRDDPDVRWVPGDYVKTRFGDVFESAPRGKMWSGLGILNSIQRIAGIYGKPISYIAGNVPFNTLAMLAQEPMSFFHDLPQVIHWKTGTKAQKRLYDRMASEAGDTRAGSGLPQFYTRAKNKTQYIEERVTGVQRGIADYLSEVADNPFRVAMFRRLARKRGYSTEGQLNRLIDAKTRQTRQDLSDIRQLTREKMLDFDALNPFQRQLASRFLYLWPFMYAATKWPIMFAREYPGRAGLIGEASAQEGRKSGPIPQSIANLIKTRFGDLDLATISPLSPIGDIAEQSQALLKDPSRLDLSVLQDRLAPTLATFNQGMGGGAKNLGLNFLRSTFPGLSELTGAYDPAMRGGKQYGPERDFLDYILQRHLRFWPRDVNEQVIQERIDKFRSDRQTTGTFEREKSDDWKKISKYYKKITEAGDYSDTEKDEIRRSYKSWWDYQEAVNQEKDSTGQRKLTTKQTATILDEIIRENYPEYTDELWDVSKIPEYEKKDAKAVDDYLAGLKKIINEGRSLIFDDYRSATADS